MNSVYLARYHWSFVFFRSQTMVIHCQPCPRRFRVPSWRQAATNSHDPHVKKWNAVLCLSFYCKLQVGVVVIDFVKLFLDLTCLYFAYDVIHVSQIQFWISSDIWIKLTKPTISQIRSWRALHCQPIFLAIESIMCWKGCNYIIQYKRINVSLLTGGLL